TASLEHSCAADYVAALRPRLSAVARVRALERALSFWGRPYDFNFDFVTDDQLVCSELVMKAYEAQGGERGLEVPYVELVGRRAVPPTEIVKAFRDQREKPERQLDFVHFLEGREGARSAVVGDADSLAATCDRPKWDIVQP
ncbi:MAG TPA: YiiX/YebB-like N1pC/P60 family cysteine hydrolase, partial [Polyangiaceae bacterium]